MVEFGNWIYENRRQVVSVCIVVFCIAALLFLPYSVLSRRGALTLIVSPFLYAAFSLYRRWWVPIVTCLLVVLLIVSFHGQEIVVSQTVSETPFREVSETDVSVVLGGDALHLYFTVQEELRTVAKEMRVTVCFYVPGSDTCVAAAHSMGLEAGQTYNISIAGETGVLVSLPATMVLADCEYGMVFAGTSCPDSDRRKYVLAGVQDVRVGEEVVVRNKTMGDVTVKVLGFSMVEDDQFLMLECVTGELGPGTSGSPIIQDGKIIGFLHGILKFPTGPVLIRSRPALEVYSSFAESLEF